LLASHGFEFADEFLAASRGELMAGKNIENYLAPYM
jgi:hypothetical protein